VRKHLKGAGYHLRGEDWSVADIKRLTDWYATTTVAEDLHLDDLAKQLGRLKTSICRKAKELGLTDQKRPKRSSRKLPFPDKVYATDEDRNVATGKRIKKYLAENEHPKGALGLKHTETSRAKMSAAVKKAWANPNSKLNSDELRQQRSDRMMQMNRDNPPANPFSRAKDGRREDLNNQYFRSAWEANYARYLNFLIKQKQIRGWEYECQTFWFETIKRGVRSYKPDFKVTFLNGSHEWHEVKGWMTDKAATAIKRFKKYYPTEKHVLVDSKWFTAAKRQGLPAIVGNWE
jgi:hypothetical protein